MTGFLTSTVTRWGLCVVAVILFAASNLPWQLDDYDQAKEAFASYELVECGHLFYQHTPNWWVATKPPFVAWVSAAFFEITRSWDLAWRFPSFVAALTLLALLWRAASIYGALAALMAMCALSFNLFTPRLASLVRTEMPLAVVIFAIGWLIWEKIRTRTAWTQRDRLLLFALLTIGTLIKGPIVYAFLLPGIAAFEWRNRRNSWGASSWSGWLPWLWSALVFLFWAAGGILFVPEFTEHVVLREFAGRFINAVHDPKPYYYYLPHLLSRFAPWSFLLIGLGWASWRTGRRNESKTAPETFWLVVWSLGGLIIVSLIPSKRVDRIFPVVPPLCLLLATLVSRLGQQERWRAVVNRACAVSIVLAVAGVTGYTVRKIILAYREHRDAYVVFGRVVVEQTAAHHWRYGVIGGEEEGMLLYVRRTEFLEPDQAAIQWNAAKLDALVVPDDEIDALLPQLRGTGPRKLLTSEPAGRYRKRYFLLAH